MWFQNMQITFYCSMCWWNMLWKLPSNLCFSVLLAQNSTPLKVFISEKTSQIKKINKYMLFLDAKIVLDRERHSWLITRRKRNCDRRWLSGSIQNLIKWIWTTISSRWFNLELNLARFQFKSQGSLCRQKMHSECDLEEFCLGTSAEVSKGA